MCVLLEIMQKRERIVERVVFWVLHIKARQSQRKHNPSRFTFPQRLEMNRVLFALQPSQVSLVKQALKDAVVRICKSRARAALTTHQHQRPNEEHRTEGKRRFHALRGAAKKPLPLCVSSSG